MHSDESLHAPQGEWQAEGKCELGQSVCASHRALSLLHLSVLPQPLPWGALTPTAHILDEQSELVAKSKWSAR